MESDWLLIKRDLYYMPDDKGYTGIRDHAGRYSRSEALARVGNGVTMVKLADAPEFSKACFDDLARNHLARQRDDLRAVVLNIQSMAERGFPIDCHKLAARCRAALNHQQNVETK